MMFYDKFVDNRTQKLALKLSIIYLRLLGALLKFHFYPALFQVAYSSLAKRGLPYGTADFSRMRLQ